MKSLFSILKKKIEDSPVLRSANASLTVEDANKILSAIFSEEAMQYMQAKYIKNGILYISCKSPVVGSEIKLHEDEIMAKISQINTATKINGIRTVL